MGPVPSAYGAPRLRPARDDVGKVNSFPTSVIPAPLASEARERDQAGTQYAVHDGSAHRSMRPTFAIADRRLSFQTPMYWQNAAGGHDTLSGQIPSSEHDLTSNSAEHYFHSILVAEKKFTSQTFELIVEGKLETVLCGFCGSSIVERRRGDAN